jgi:hypothetical protein
MTTDNIKFLLLISNSTPYLIIFTIINIIRLIPPDNIIINIVNLVIESEIFSHILSIFSIKIVFLNFTYIGYLHN